MHPKMPEDMGVLPCPVVFISRGEPPSAAQESESFPQKPALRPIWGDPRPFLGSKGAQGVVRATPGRPLPARGAKRQDLAGVLDGCPCHFCAFDAIHVAPGWVLSDDP